MIKEEIQREIREYFEINKNKETTCKSLWDSAVVLRGKLIAINVYIKKEEKSQNNYNLPS